MANGRDEDEHGPHIAAWHPQWHQDAERELGELEPKVLAALHSIERQKLRRKDDALMARVLVMQATILLAVLADILLQITGVSE